jgi:membrane dipeptidase
MLVDAHLDLAYNAVCLGADLRLPLDQLRSSEAGRRAAERAETSTVSLPAIRDADIRLVFGTLFVQKQTALFNLIGPAYTTPEEANVQGWDQLRYYHALAEAGEILLVDRQATLDRALAAEPAVPGLVPLMEGADPIRDLDELAAWFDAGLRIVGPAWSGTRYAGGTGAPGPLTPAGRELMRGLHQSGLALDTSHLAEESFWEALQLFDGPVMASHSNCRALVPTDRQLSDEMIRALVERDGVIGIVLGNPFIVSDYRRGDPKAQVPLAAVVRQIEHICTIAGDARHVGIGSDFDGGFGVEAVPDGIDAITDLPRIGDALAAAGWSAADVRGVLGENWVRWLRTALPA